MRSLQVISFVFIVLFSFGCASNNNDEVNLKIEKLNTKIDSLTKKVTENQYNISNIADRPDGSLHRKVLSEKVNNIENQFRWLKREYTAKQTQDLSPLKEDETKSLQNVTQERVIQVKSNVIAESIEGKYAKARRNYLAGDFVQAARLFSNIVKNYQGEGLAINAQYWLGETYYDRGKMSQAITEFQKVIDFFPKSSKAPDSQLKIGLCYKKMGNISQAEIELKRVRKNYPAYKRLDFLNSLLKELK